MKFIVDENLPPRLVAWLRKCGHDAIHCRDVLVEDRSDDALARVATAEQRIIVTKDSDFDPPCQNARVLRLRVGNCSNAILFERLTRRLDDALARFARDEIYVEVV